MRVAVASLKDMKRRKSSIENIMKITKAMELVAFSKLRKSKQRVIQAEPFFKKIFETMIEISRFAKHIDSDFFAQKTIKKRCCLVVAADKGLAGSYNSNILRFAQENLKNFDKQDILIIPIGKKAVSYFKKKNYDIYFEYSDISEEIDLEQAFEISKKIVAGFLKNDFQEFSLVYTDFVSVLVQRPSLKKILPLSLESDNINLDNKINNNLICEPSPKAVFEKIVPQYVAGVLYGAVVESFAAEQSARRMAMDSANKSAQDMIKDIDIIFNKARQSGITQEITEISSGANAI